MSRTDGLIKLDETGERVRRITLDIHNDEPTEHLTTLQTGKYAQIDAVIISTLRTVIEIYRETERKMNIDNYHSPMLDGV